MPSIDKDGQRTRIEPTRDERIGITIWIIQQINRWFASGHRTMYGLKVHTRRDFVTSEVAQSICDRRDLQSYLPDENTWNRWFDEAVQVSSAGAEEFQTKGRQRLLEQIAYTKKYVTHKMESLAGREEEKRQYCGQLEKLITLEADLLGLRRKTLELEGAGLVDAINTLKTHTQPKSPGETDEPESAS